VPESGIILPVPEAESLVAALRQQHDPVARLGVPAHITLLYPFAPPEAALEEIEHLAELFAAFGRFAFSLVDVGRFPRTSFLVLDDPQPFLRMTEAIVRRWPQYPPYGGVYSEVIPHLTVADHVGAEVMSAVEHALRAQLPLRCHASEAWLICSDHDGRWKKVRSFELR
jgi:2'-5' RNA ligase